MQKWLLLLFILLSGCSNIQLRHEGVIVTKEGTSKQFVHEKSFDTGNFPIVCGVTAILYGGYCWNYGNLPTPEKKLEFVQKTEVLLDKEIGQGHYTIVSDKVENISSKDGPDNFFVRDFKDMKTAPENQKSYFAKEVEMRRLEKFNTLSVNFRSKGVGVFYNRQLTDQISLGLGYFNQTKESARAQSKDLIKRSNDFGLDLNWFFDRGYKATGFFLSSRVIYSHRSVYSQEEDVQEMKSRPKNKSAYYGDLAFGLRIYTSMNISFNFQFGKGVEFAGSKANGRSNYETFEAAIGITY